MWEVRHHTVHSLDEATGKGKRVVKAMPSALVPVLTFCLRFLHLVHAVLCLFLRFVGPAPSQDAGKPCPDIVASFELTGISWDPLTENLRAAS